MLIDGPIRPLGYVDCRRLTERVLACEESAWFADARRQDDYEVHVETQSIILVFFSGWPEVRVTHAAGWDRFGDLALPIMQELVGRHYPAGGMVLRVILARVPAKRRIERHLDTHPSFSVAHRIHVPLAINPDVEFIVGMERIPLRIHHAFELNNAMPHSVSNDGDTARIHMIFDYSPG
ncbi:MAG: aspartyl/asparaginyl beta-hydroxylase domain-containing protein [Pseudomonadota bacterium]|nr:aspartyl/asparaginyl beta-hydroxylase domain-containing protein [Pseudomonadota bacterium]